MHSIPPFRRRAGLLLLLTGIALPVVAGSLEAQQQAAPQPLGFHLGLHLNGSSLRFTDEETTETGGGLGFVGGGGASGRNLRFFWGAR